MSTINNSNISIASGQIGPIHELEGNIFTAEATTPAGEKIFFAMEPMSNGKKWEVYKNTAQFLVSGGNVVVSIGSFTQIGSLITDAEELTKFFSTRSCPEFWTHDKARFEELSAKLKERNITLESPKAKELRILQHASNGMNVRSQTHVVYASKTPITGLANFETSSGPFSFGTYVETYDHLIMSVGVTISDIVENRGIFRNPWSVVQGGYGGISMMMHSFTCLAAQKYCPSIKWFKVRPFKQMGEIFMKSIPKEQFTVNGIRADQYDQGFEVEQEVLVPVDVLANLR